MFTSKDPVVADAVNKRVAVHFLDNLGSFIGRLAKFDSETYVLDQCETIPGRDETAQPIKGRQYVDRINCWLQELPT